MENPNMLKMPPKRSARQRGFALVELIIAVSVAALLAVYASAELAKKSEEHLAEGAATYISAVAGAAEAHVLLNFVNYEAGTAIPGVATLLAPTIAELVALGRLNPGFPSGAGALPTRQTVAISIRRAGCPGPGCTLTTLACTTTPVTLGGANTRFDLASTMVSAQGGRGGQSLQNNGAFIRGPSINTPNPIAGNPEGIVCGSAIVDTAVLNSFVRINDTRNPNLQGQLSVQGATNLNNTLAVTGATTLNSTLAVAGNTTLSGTATISGNTGFGACARILAATGRAGFGCANPDDVPVGMVGGVRSADVVAQGTVLASTAPGAFTGTNGNYAIMTANNGTGVAEMRTSGRAAADRLTPLGQFASGAVCAAADEGSIARLAGGPGLVACTQGFWRVFTFQAAANDACSPNGATARDASGRTLVCVNGTFEPMDELFRTGAVGQVCGAPGTTAIDTTSNNETLICRINLAGGIARYMRLRDVTTQLVFVSSTEVAPNTAVVKPTCNGHASQVPVPVIQLIPKVWGTPDGGSAFFAENAGASWTVRMRDGNGNNLTGVPNSSAIAQLYCYFP